MADLQSDGDKLAAWLREGADEIDKAHAVLDVAGVPRSIPGSDVECTLAARIALITMDAENPYEVRGV